MSNLEEIRDILLSHKGKANSITSAQIANAIGISEDDTHAQTRALILECAKKYELPVAANNRGYYLIANKKEYNDYNKNLEGRKNGIEERKKLITKNYKGK